MIETTVKLSAGCQWWMVSTFLLMQPLLTTHYSL